MEQVIAEILPTAFRVVIRGAAWSNCDATVLRHRRATNTPLRDRNNLGFRTFLNAREPVPET